MSDEDEEIQQMREAFAYRCECSGCWACEGRVAGCTCDVDWDKVFHSD